MITYRTAQRHLAASADAEAVTCVSNFSKLNPDVSRIIISYTRPDEASPKHAKDGLPVEWLGYAGNLDTLLAPSKTCRAFNRLTQPLIAAYKPVIRKIQSG